MTETESCAEASTGSCSVGVGFPGDYDTKHVRNTKIQDFNVEEDNSEASPAAVWCRMWDIITENVAEEW